MSCGMCLCVRCWLTVLWGAPSASEINNPVKQTHIFWVNTYIKFLEENLSTHETLIRSNSKKGGYPKGETLALNLEKSNVLVCVQSKYCFAISFKESSWNLTGKSNYAQMFADHTIPSEAWFSIATRWTRYQCAQVSSCLHVPKLRGKWLRNFSSITSVSRSSSTTTTGPSWSSSSLSLPCRKSWAVLLLNSPCTFHALSLEKINYITHLRSCALFVSCVSTAGTNVHPAEQ